MSARRSGTSWTVIHSDVTDREHGARPTAFVFRLTSDEVQVTLTLESLAAPKVRRGHHDWSSPASFEEMCLLLTSRCRPCWLRIEHDFAFKQHFAQCQFIL